MKSVTIFCLGTHPGDGRADGAGPDASHARPRRWPRWLDSSGDGGEHGRDQHLPQRAPERRQGLRGLHEQQLLAGPQPRRHRRLLRPVQRGRSTAVHRRRGVLQQEQLHDRRRPEPVLLWRTAARTATRSQAPPTALVSPRSSPPRRRTTSSIIMNAVYEPSLPARPRRQPRSPAAGRLCGMECSIP